MAQPRNTHTLPDGKPLHTWAKLVNPPHDFMPWNNGQDGVGQFTINNVQVCAAYATGQHLHPDFTRAGRGVGQLFPL
jgi:hypothetical protein